MFLAEPLPEVLGIYSVNILLCRSGGERGRQAGGLAHREADRHHTNASLHDLLAGD